MTGLMLRMPPQRHRKLEAWQRGKRVRGFPLYPGPVRVRDVMRPELVRTQNGTISCRGESQDRGSDSAKGCNRAKNEPVDRPTRLPQSRTADTQERVRRTACVFAVHGGWGDWLSGGVVAATQAADLVPGPDYCRGSGTESDVQGGDTTT